MTSLYRYFDKDGRLLYVGVSNRWPIRQSNHRDGAPWWQLATSQTIEHYPTWAEALAAESAAIIAERPIYNRTLPRTERQKEAHRLWRKRNDWRHRRPIRAAARKRRERHEKAVELWQGRRDWPHRKARREAIAAERVKEALARADRESVVWLPMDHHDSAGHPEPGESCPCAWPYDRAYLEQGRKVARYDHMNHQQRALVDALLAGKRSAEKLAG